MPKQILSVPAYFLSSKSHIMIDGYSYWDGIAGDIGVEISQREEQLNKRQKSRYASLLRAAEKDLAGFIEHYLK
ncbi:MAG: hypothetical protein NC112_06575 [Oxalobacter formigenes]|nr:hypothetical protein [Oxalobacter formigenes]